MIEVRYSMVASGTPLQRRLLPRFVHPADSGSQRRCRAGDSGRYVGLLKAETQLFLHFQLNRWLGGRLQFRYPFLKFKIINDTF